jgi:hypothetical protein
MGWNAGSGLFAELIFIVQKNVPDDDSRREIYEHMIDAFKDQDWDELAECKGSDTVYDDIIDELYPTEEDEEKEDDEDY